MFDENLYRTIDTHTQTDTCTQRLNRITPFPSEQEYKNVCCHLNYRKHSSHLPLNISLTSSFELVCNISVTPGGNVSRFLSNQREASYVTCKSLYRFFKSCKYMNKDIKSRKLLILVTNSLENFSTFGQRVVYK